MGNRRWIAGLVALVAVVSTTGCGRGRDEEGGASGSKQQPTIAVFIPNGGDPYFQNKSYGYIKAARELGVKVQLFDAGGYANAEKQIQQMEDAIQRKVDGMVVSATDSKAVCTSVKEAMDAGIPVVGDDILPTCDRKIPFGISENSVKVGYNNCNFTAERLNGKGNIVMVKGPPGAEIAIKRANGCKQALKKYPGIKVIDEQFNDSNIDASSRLMDDFISAHGKSIDAAYSFNAVNGLGVINALKSAGFKPGDVDVTTIDYHPAVLQYMKNGWVSGTVPAQPVRLAYEAVKAASDLAAKRPVQGESGIDPCCEKRTYTADDDVIDTEHLSNWDSSNAVAPKGWKPPLQS
jgi:inositol transport system substrate-binding protein